MRLAVVGDTHGDSSWLCNTAIPYAARHGADRIIQLGDFGFVWPDPNYLHGLRKLDRVLGRHNLSLIFLPGNHDDHDKLVDWERRIHGRNDDGHLQLTDRIAYTGRVSAWVWENRWLAAIGGAVSIDRDYRIAYRAGRRHNRKPIWWPEEVLTDDEAATAKGLGTVDVLFTHDAPTTLPLPLKPDLDSTANRQRMTDIGRALRPRVWLHGHYHHRTTYRFDHQYGGCEVHSLDCNRAPVETVVELLDLKEEP